MLDVSFRFRNHVRMEEREELKRLGSHVRSRRLMLDYKRAKDLADAMGITPRVLYDIEGGKRRVGQQTYSNLELTLRWNVGSVDATLRGGEPTPLNPQSREEAADEMSRGDSHIAYDFRVADNSAAPRLEWSVEREIDMVTSQLARLEVELVANRARLAELLRRRPDMKGGTEHGESSDKKTPEEVEGEMTKAQIALAAKRGSIEGDEQ